MTLHYHGTPITPDRVLQQLAGKHFCVSFAQPQQIKRCHEIGQSVMLDNGAFSMWRKGARVSWDAYYRWCDLWLDHPNTWAVIPDVIDGPEGLQDGLLLEWPHGTRGAPVWHMHESLDRLRRLVDEWPRVCFGSSGEFATVMAPNWRRRTDEAWNTLARRAQRLPWVHMLRGMQCAGRQWPFASLDSTDIGRNHNREQNVAWAMADKWDGVQCPTVWKVKEGT